MSPPGRDNPCPPPGRFWEAVLRASWTDAERSHLVGCPSCQAMEGRLRAALAGVTDCPAELQTAPEDLAVPPQAATDGTTGIEITTHVPSAERDWIGGKAGGPLGDSSVTAPASASDRTAAQVAPWLERPTRLGRYVLVRKLAEGGMSSVYEAHDSELGRTVALKVSAAFLGLSQTPRLDRFLREARVAACLDHPALLPIYEVGRSGETLYIASRYVDGTDLRQRIRTQGPLPWPEAVSIVEQVAEGVGHAHERGIIHRDIKPSNILVDRDGKPYLADFGLARSFQDDDETSLTREGVIIGTPTYMAPEQAMGQVALQGPAMDIYGLGATLYALLTGHPPFRGSNAIDTIRRAVETDAAPPRAINSSIPRDLDLVCMKAMARDPSLRYPTARALADDLRLILAGIPLPSSRARLSLSGRWSRPGRHRLRWALAAAALGPLLLVVPRVVPSRANPRLQTAVDSTSSRTPEPSSASERTPRVDDLETEVEAHSLRVLQGIEQDGGRTGGRDRSPHELVLALVGQGHCYALLKRPADAIPAYLRALDLLKSIRGQSPDDPRYRDELDGMYRLTIVALRAAGREDEAKALEREAAGH